MTALALGGRELHITMHSRGGTTARAGSMRALGCRMYLLWSGSRATTPLHQEQSSAKRTGSVGQVQWRRECEPVR